MTFENGIYQVYAGYIPLICMVYIRFQDFVGSITVAPTQPRRIFWTTFHRLTSGGQTEGRDCIILA